MDRGCSEGPGCGNSDDLAAVPSFPLKESVSLWLGFAQGGPPALRRSYLKYNQAQPKSRN